jgi:GLPGLI family protein
MLKLKLQSIVILIVTFIFSTFCFGQVTRVIFKKAVYAEEGDSIRKKNVLEKLTASQRQALELVLKVQDRVEFELIYDATQSIYKKIDHLGVGNDNIAKIENVMNTEVYYKNSTTKEKLYQTEIGGKTYNVIVPFEQFKWNITTESKIINGYTCYKATTTLEDMYNPRKNRKLTFTPVVWFTPSIASSYGPKGLDGLPGLVLEGAINGKTYFYASKIELNQTIKIERPKKGKDVSEKEYETIFLETIRKEDE